MVLNSKMPDIAMCPSTVCAVRKICERNWDSGIHKPDRGPQEQEWVPPKYYGIVWNVSVFRNDVSLDASKCPYYINVK